MRAPGRICFTGALFFFFFWGGGGGGMDLGLGLLRKRVLGSRVFSL